MNNKFILWACGVILVAILGVTSYGVIAGALDWKDYQTLWAGTAGTFLGYIVKSVSLPKE